MPFGDGYDDAECCVFFGSSGRVEVNYEKPDPQRPFALTVEDKTFYVDPNLLGRVSPVLKAMCQGRFSEGITGSATLKNEKADDIHSLLQAVCPTMFGLYPKEINIFSFPPLCVLADRYQIPGLRDALETYVTDDYIRKAHWLSGPLLLSMFDASIKGRLGVGAQAYLLYRIMQRSLADQYGSDSLLATPTGNLLLKAFIHHAAGRLSHRPNEAFQHLPYHACHFKENCSNRRRNPGSINPARIYSVCTDCKMPMCRKCSDGLCERAIRSFLEEEELGEL